MSAVNGHRSPLKPNRKSAPAPPGSDVEHHERLSTRSDPSRATGLRTSEDRERQPQTDFTNLADIRVPIFNVGAVQDHVAPWRSVFKLHGLTDAEQTFVLTAGGHNVGIVNPPGRARTSYRIRRWQSGDRLLTPDEWLERTPQIDDSWWTAWFDWLHRHSSGMRKPPRIGAPGTRSRDLVAAPGSYVLER